MRSEGSACGLASRISTTNLGSIDMRKALFLTVAAMLVFGIGTSYGEIPREREGVLPGG